METNTTILTRDVVILDSHKRLGNVKALRVDCDTLSVSHYIVNSSGTSSALVLPFEKALAVGDTFMTVQSRDDFLATSNAEATRLLQEGYVLLEAEVFSKTGNQLGKIQGFEFDPVFGTVTKLYLNDQISFGSDTFLFFSSEFVFLDDGIPTAAELRAGAPVPDSSSQMSFSTISTDNDDAEVDDEAAEGEETQENEEIEELLMGSTLNADVESEDGAFKVSKGTVLTREIIDEALEHDALLLLTVNIDV